MLTKGAIVRVMRRVDPLVYAFACVALFGAIRYYQPAQGYRKAVGAWLYQPVCEVPPGREFSIEYYGLIYTGNSSNLADQRVLCLGAWEKHVLHFLGQTAEMLSRQTPDSADDLSFVDIGANLGLHSLYMSQLVGQVHAFEPYPPVIAKMRRNFEQNELQNVTIHPVGLGEESARLPFVEPPQSNEGIGSFVEDLDLGAVAGGLELDVVVGDDYFEEHGIGRVDIAKIDVEGFEKPVLLGLRETFAKSRPIIVMEVSARSGVDGLFESREDLAAALPKDYELFSFVQWDSMTGAYRLGGLEVDFDAELDQWDVIAAPREIAAQLPMSAKPSW